MTLIISTTLQGSVNITAPAPAFMAAVTHGGFGRIPDPEPDPLLAASEARQIEGMIASGYDADFAARYVDALLRGGETDAGGLDLIRQRHLANDVNHRTMELAELPGDRIFRDAWRQDAESGAIYVDLVAAKLLFARRLVAAKAAAIANLGTEIEIRLLQGQADEELEAAHRALKDIDLQGLAEAIARAGTPDGLKALWPSYLAQS
jgi:hypothetical protein